MKKINPDELEEGMVLAQPLVDSFGRVLLEKGEVLKELYVRKLKAWNIDELFVEDVEQKRDETTQLTEQQIKEKIGKMEENLEKTFAGINSANMKVIRKAARDYLARRIEERYKT
jgi:2',3'-cyclic-nucleotide 2'-phosphodiesterase (5'-nucleotidase family)